VLAGLIVDWLEVDDQRDEPVGAQASWPPAVLFHPDHPYTGQPVRPGSSDQVCGLRASRSS